MHGTLPLPLLSTYLSPENLGFSQEDFDALVWFVEQYDAGNIVDYDGAAKLFRTDFGPDNPPDKFFMRMALGVSECGTAGCIYGWVAHRVSHKGMCSWPIPIYALFKPVDTAIKAAHARDATVRVLRGEEAWPRP